MSFHGGMLGVIASMVWFARSRARPFWQVMDFVAPCVPTGLAAGRVGNFINGELWGRFSSPDLPWGMVFPQSGSMLPRHPSQVYQFLLEGLLLFVVLWLYARKERARAPVSAVFLIGYGADALHRRVLPRARRLPRPAGAQHEHGPVAVRADDRRSASGSMLVRPRPRSRDAGARPERRRRQGIPERDSACDPRR